MRFDLRQLQAFVMLAESANYREAASRLFVTQPALTKQIQGLEQALGSTLFNRGRHGAELTAIGLQLLPQAKALVDHGKGFERHALALASGAAGRLNIGFGLSSFALAPSLVARFKQQAPDVLVHLRDTTSAIQQEHLLAGRLQLGFMRRPDAPQLREHRLLTDRLVLAVPTRVAGPDFDLERALIRGSLDVADLEAAWNARFLADFGVAVPKASLGVLQDVHWSVGLFGYFPTYTLGNVYAGCLFKALQADLPEMEADLARGDTAAVTGWLKTRLRSFGALRDGADTIRHATGEAPDEGPLLAYLEEKFGALAA